MDVLTGLAILLALAAGGAEVLNLCAKRVTLPALALYTLAVVVALIGSTIAIVRSLS